MYDLEDLFDERGIVGAKLEQLLKEKKCTKAELYKNTGVSRPTIDKILAGTITSKKNYETHMGKIIDYLHITPDFFWGNALCGANRIREVRNTIRISTEEIAKATGIQLSRLQQIEAGEKATVGELRDLAMVLGTSTRVLTGEYFFEPQVGTLDCLMEEKEFSGFWGNIGILLKGQEQYIWFPISGNTRKWIYHTINDELLVVPCMNNKVLFFYMPNVKEVILLDEASDSPYDENVSCGAIPLVLFEALEEYFMDKLSGESHDDHYTEKLMHCMHEYIAKHDLTEDNFGDLLQQGTIYYADGEARFISPDYDRENDIVNQIELVYGYEMSTLENSFLFFTDQYEETEVFINMKDVSMIELPFLKVEESICRNWVDE